MALGGRPKKEGGHKPLKISVNAFMAKALEKVGNKSEFLESVARPVLEKLDPGEASVFLWKIDVYLSQGIIKATREGDFNQVQALGWLATQLEDARKLCGIPESNEKKYEPFILSGEKPSSFTWKEEALETTKTILDAIAYQDPDVLGKIPEATLIYLRTLPSEIKENLKPDMERLDKLIKSAYNEKGMLSSVQVQANLAGIARRDIPEILEKMLDLLA